MGIGFSVVDAALGHRYLLITVQNCGQRAIGLPSSPPIELTTMVGESQPVTWTPRTADDEALTLPAGGRRYLRLDWLSSGRCERGAVKLAITLAGTTAHRSDCFQLGGLADEPAVGHLAWSRSPKI